MYSDGQTHGEAEVSTDYRNEGGVGCFILRQLLRRIEIGALTVLTPSGVRVQHTGHEPGPEAVLVLHRWRALRKLLFRGNIGFGEAYMAGDWSSPDVPALIELAARNSARIESMIEGGRPARLVNQLRHALRMNSMSGSRRNISFHYDLGNDFYRLWLDQSMTYSSALYATPTDTLEQAQQAKTARIIGMLGVRQGAKVLEIGFGWGALAAEIARAGGHVTGLTLSREQLVFAQDRIAGEGLSQRVALRLQDYRDADGGYDHIVSIEMLEAVGERYWPTYFRTIRERLNAGGTAVLQAITIAEDRLDHYRGTTDFIQRYIFPGGMLPTQALIAEHAANAGLTLTSSETFGDSYQRTLAEWRRRFVAAGPSVEQLGFDGRFRRLWEYYLSYCEGGFRAGTINVGLYQLRG